MSHVELSDGTPHLLAVLYHAAVLRGLTANARKDHA
jgi:hypothetical protein